MSTTRRSPLPRRAGRRVLRGANRVPPSDVQVRPDEAVQLQRAAKRVTANPADDEELFWLQAKIESTRAPARIASILSKFKSTGGASGTLLVGGLPVGNIPSTPTRLDHHIAERTDSARIAAILCSMLGELVAYESEAQGRLFEDIVPDPKFAHCRQHRQSALELQAHTTHPGSALAPRWICLTCLTGDPDAVTYTVSARKLAARLADPDVVRLREPLWLVETDEVVRGPMPIVFGPPDDPRLYLDPAQMVGITPDAQSLLHQITRLYPRLHDEHVLEPGQLLLVDNTRAAVGRSAYSPRYDGTDRFLVRSYAVEHLMLSAHARRNGGRTIHDR